MMKDQFYSLGLDVILMILYIKHNSCLQLDIDECADDIHPCHPHAECSNTPGSCICTCENDYTGDGIYCEGKP